ncbi:Reverse transcriptase RNA-dependent DNA polymerase [Trinorchestia longiramus]|nr:Reverse transcriptase RNA-dependent DNA polymerase [Trinorchestia longiramus]
MKLENGQNLQDLLKGFVELFEELAIIGDATEEDERVISLLSSLPDKFSTLKRPSKEIECGPSSFPQEEKHEDSEGELELRRSTRNRTAPDRYGEWVCLFQNKTNPDGSVGSYKARLVAQEYAQKVGIDYDETFSPVVRFESVRAVLAHAAKHNLQLHHMDVATVFLNVGSFTTAFDFFLILQRLGADALALRSTLLSEKACGSSGWIGYWRPIAATNSAVRL